MYTTTLYGFFKSNHISGAHFVFDGASWNGPTLDQIMYDNYIKKNEIDILPRQNNKSLMYYGDFGEYIFYGHHHDDILFVNKSYKCDKCTVDKSYRTWYEILSKKYPNSLFILNIRKINNWLTSRYFYQFGRYDIQYMKDLSINEILMF